MSVSRTGRHHVVIVGCGFGGLAAAKAVRRADVDVTVIDRTNHHLIQPLLCQVATGIRAKGNIATPIREILRHLAGTIVGTPIVSTVTRWAAAATQSFGHASTRDSIYFQQSPALRAGAVGAVGGAPRAGRPTTGSSSGLAPRPRPPRPGGVHPSHAGPFWTMRVSALTV